MLYEAMRTILVDEGPLRNLYADRLPAEQTAPVDVAHIPQGGGSPQRYLGSEPVVGGAPGVTHDGGVLWHVTNVQFQARSVDAVAVMEVADRIRNVLIQYAGDSVVKAGVEVVRCELTASPHYYDQDEQERVIMAVVRGVAQTRVSPLTGGWNDEQVHGHRSVGEGRAGVLGGCL